MGEPKDVARKMIEYTVPYLPKDKPRYLMGVGSPDDLIDGAIRGIDMYDSVLPTRVARHGAVMTSMGRININSPCRICYHKNLRILCDFTSYQYFLYISA